MPRRKTQKPGETSSGPGKYKEVVPKGGKSPKQRKIEITPDDGHIPSTQEVKRES